MDFGIGFALGALFIIGCGKFFSDSKEQKIARLLVVRAGLIAQIQELRGANRGNSFIAGELGETEEKLRQLGWKEAA